MLQGLAELPAGPLASWLVTCLGRRLASCGTFLVTGLACLALALLPGMGLWAFKGDGGRKVRGI